MDTIKALLLDDEKNNRIALNKLIESRLMDQSHFLGFSFFFWWSFLLLLLFFGMKNM